MKRVLAIDTSSRSGGVALVQRATGASTPEVVAELGQQAHELQAVHLLDWIERVLEIAGWQRSELDEFVAIRGPGSFTGIRIGLGATQGLALAAGRPCRAVGTLPAVAEAFGVAPVERFVALDAGRAEVYAARYDPASSPPREIEPPFRALLEPAMLHVPGPVVLIHSPSLAARLTALADDRRFTHPSPAPSPLAGAAGRLSLLRESDPRSAETFAPLYLRPPDVRGAQAR